jgi:hypothetical protein
VAVAIRQLGKFATVLVDVDVWVVVKIGLVVDVVTEVEVPPAVTVVVFERKVAVLVTVRLVVEV